MYIFLLIIILVSALIIAYILIGKFPQLTLVETSSSVDDKQEDLKKALLEQRLKRQFIGGFRIVLSTMKPVWDKIVSLLDNLVNSFKKKEEEYRHKLLHADFKEEVDKEQKISKLQTEAQEMVSANDIKEAEARYIDILKLDPKNKEAYMKLAKIYWDQKDYEHAIELYNYLLKIVEDGQIYSNLGAIAEERGNLKEAEDNYLSALKSDDTTGDVYINLAKLYNEQEEMEKALEMTQKALQIEPNNPKYLDFLLQISIMVQDKKLANETWQALVATNPDNRKLEEYKELVDEL
ncbi:tetratricopeptide repeat protein [Patescibacteria group bacterium]|nr:tetratricopeptide repeat protein [Patescibacteria group bacterium]